MFRNSRAYPMVSPGAYFRLWDIKGTWESREGSPKVRVYRNLKCKNGGYHLEIAYNEKDVFRLPIKRDMARKHYIDFYGNVKLSYDYDRDVLLLSDYGEYFRATDGPQV